MDEFLNVNTNGPLSGYAFSFFVPDVQTTNVVDVVMRCHRCGCTYPVVFCMNEPTEVSCPRGCPGSTTVVEVGNLAAVVKERS